MIIVDSADPAGHIGVARQRLIQVSNVRIATMFGLGFGEIILIMVVVLLVFGPEKLPEIARTLGRSMAELRRTVDEVKNELTQPRNDLEKDLLHRDSSAFRPLEGTCEQDTAPAQPTLPITGASEPVTAVSTEAAPDPAVVPEGAPSSVPIPDNSEKLP